mmetsp:Transcript_21205/g.38274  ORF Transcript_21205/g.38274 Transcript_21205/m.38274 type:complete len:89 (+) Transcript_21205:1078-1344(+)
MLLLYFEACVTFQIVTSRVCTNYASPCICHHFQNIHFQSSDRLQQYEFVDDRITLLFATVSTQQNLSKSGNKYGRKLNKTTVQGDVPK